MDHSISQLYLLHEANGRRDAKNGLRMLQTVTAASSIAHNGKSAKGYWDEINKALSKQAGTP